MKPKTRKMVRERQKRVGLHGVSRGFKSLTSRLGVLGDLKGPKQAREWLILSLSEMGQELGKFVGRPLHKSTVSLWERGLRPLPLEVVCGYAELISEKISSLIDRRVEVGIEVNSPWRVSAYAQCPCGQWFKMHDAKSRHCPRCSRKR